MAASAGTVSVVGNQLRFIGADGFSGDAVISYSVSDGEGGTAFSTATVTVTPVNDAPEVASPLADRSAEDADAISFDVSSAFTDEDSGPLNFTASGLPAGLSISSAGVITGTIDRSASQTNGGSYTVAVTATDGDGGTATDSFTWTITNPAPVAVADTASVLRNGVLEVRVLRNDADPDGDGLALVAATASRGSVQVLPGGVLRYTPERGFIGGVTLRYTLRDGDGATAAGAAAVEVLPDAPAASDDAYEIGLDGTLVRRGGDGVLRNDRASDGSAAGLVATLVEAPLRGSVTLNSDGSFRYASRSPVATDRPSPGPDFFRYRLSDVTGLSSTARVTLNPPPPSTMRLLAAAAADLRQAVNGRAQGAGWTVGVVLPEPPGTDPATRTGSSRPAVAAAREAAALPSASAPGPRTAATPRLRGSRCRQSTLGRASEASASLLPEPRAPSRWRAVPTGCR